MHTTRQNVPLWQKLAFDLLLAAILLLIYSFIQIQLPALRAKHAAREAAALRAAEEALAAAEAAAEPEPLIEAEVAAEPEPEVDSRTPWQIKFAEHFTDEPVMTDHSYTSPYLSINIETVSRKVRYGTAVYYVADIYIASPEQFRTYTANDELVYYSTQLVGDMDAASHAVLSMNGDCYSYQKQGFLMRNGEVYMSDQTGCDLLVLYDDGRMEALSPSAYRVADVIAAGAVQTWNFGPSLLDANGHTKPWYEVSQAVGFQNPRSAVGYFEPGHYCFVTVDGRQEHSNGMLMGELATVFEELGCTMAYNLDGGGSAVMYFNHQPFSSQSNPTREIGDILIITEEGFD